MYEYLKLRPGQNTLTDRHGPEFVIDMAGMRTHARELPLLTAAAADQLERGRPEGSVLYLHCRPRPTTVLRRPWPQSQLHCPPRKRWVRRAIGPYESLARLQAGHHWWREVTKSNEGFLNVAQPTR